MSTPAISSTMSGIVALERQLAAGKRTLSQDESSGASSDTIAGDQTPVKADVHALNQAMKAAGLDGHLKPSATSDEPTSAQATPGSVDITA